MRRRRAGHGHFGAGQRLDALHACAADVDRQLEGLFFVFSNLLRRMLRGKAERRCRPLGGQRGFEQQQFLELDPLAQCRDVIDDGGRELLGPEPHASEGMALGEHHQGVQAGLFNGRAKQQGQVQTGGQAGLSDLARPAYLLPGVLETGRRQGVVQTHGGHGAPDRRTQLPGALAATLVAVQRRALAVLAKDLGGLLEQSFNGRLVGLHEGRHQVWQVGQAAPLVARQQFDRSLEPEEIWRRIVSWAKRQRDNGLFCLGQPGEQRAVKLDIQVRYLTAAAGCHGIDAPGLRLEEAGRGGDPQLQILRNLLGVVDDAQLPEHRHRVLEVCEVELGDQRGLDMQTFVRT